jgi:hypothetical protein
MTAPSSSERQAQSSQSFEARIAGEVSTITTEPEKGRVPERQAS